MSTTATPTKTWPAPQYGRCARCEADADLRREMIATGRLAEATTADLAGLALACGYCRQWERMRWAAIEQRATRGDTPTTAPPATWDSPSICFENIVARPVEWLWPAYIPLGMLTLIDGDPGLGKSFITTDLAARVSRGLPMPPLGGEPVADPAGVLLCNAEDDPARTILPRLVAAGADLTRIHQPDLKDDEGKGRPVVLPGDLPPLEKIIAAHGVRLVVFDPLMAFLASNVDSHKDADSRRVLHRLKELAERHQCAIVIVRHLNKLVNVGSALHRGGGSIGIIGAARAAFLVGRHPRDDGQCVLARVKGNLCAEPPAQAYAIEQGRLAWIGEVDVRADDLLARKGVPGRPGDAVGKATEFLTEYLANGDRLARDVETEAERLGIQERTLRRAKRDLGIIAIAPVSKGGPWTWRLPEGPAKSRPKLQNNIGHLDLNQAKTSVSQESAKNIASDGDPAPDPNPEPYGEI